jgi:hypothetical protein
MSFFKRFYAKVSDREVDAVLAGRQTGGELDDVATFFRELRENLVEAPLATLEATHLAAISEATRLAPSPATQQRPRFRRLAARTTIAAVGLALVAAFGGAAYAGALPSGVQGKVADIVGNVGLSLPGRDHPKKHNGGNLEQPHTSTQPTVSDPGQSGGDQSGGGNEGGGAQTGSDQNGGANQNGGDSHNGGGDTGNEPGGGSAGGGSAGDQGSSGSRRNQKTTTDPTTTDSSGGQDAGNGDQGGSSGGNSGSGDQNQNN